MANFATSILNFKYNDLVNFWDLKYWKNGNATDISFFFLVDSRSFKLAENLNWNSPSNNMAKKNSMHITKHLLIIHFYFVCFWMALYVKFY
uniref:Uncharacterized protein n=1 Tax=Rhizophagus irregularis (strain DAOM 181602 / DAOM 197198 / MUCL 43194) TaxID=747089 RepID=U9UQ58_RHIID